MKRSLLPFGRLFHFLFGTAKDKDIKSMKQDIKRLYDNQVSQSKVLNDVISIVNILRGLINKKILKINHIVSTITFLNDTMDSNMSQLRPLFLQKIPSFAHGNINTSHQDQISFRPNAN